MTKRLGVQEPPGPDATIPIRARAVRIPIVGDASCATTFADFQPGYFVPISDLCAGTAGHNVCFGDSGGPLYAQDRGALVQIGITSRGAGCATRLFPSIFTDVRRLAPWILRNMANACTTQVPGGASIPGQPAAPLFAC
jgi:secreted trypsin-like serine protease